MAKIGKISFEFGQPLFPFNHLTFGESDGVYVNWMVFSLAFFEGSFLYDLKTIDMLSS